MASITNDELVSDLEEVREIIANRSSTVAERMAAMKHERAMVQELERRAALVRNSQPAAAPSNLGDLDSWEKEQGYTLD